LSIDGKKKEYSEIKNILKVVILEEPSAIKSIGIKKIILEILEI